MFVMVFPVYCLGPYTLSPIPIIAYIHCFYQSSLVQLSVLSTQVFAKEPRHSLGELITWISLSQTPFNTRVQPETTRFRTWTVVAVSPIRNLTASALEPSSTPYLTF